LALPRGGSLQWQGSPLCNARITYRAGGERIMLAGRSQSQSVKKLLSTRIPPWQRDRLPFVYNEQGELLAVGDVLIAHSLQQHSGTLIWHHQP
jgi:tRNA(Ile)-lysidine synthase